MYCMYSQSTSGSTQPGERPVIARSGDVSSTRQHSSRGTPLNTEIAAVAILPPPAVTSLTSVTCPHTCYAEHSSAGIN